MSDWRRRNPRRCAGETPSAADGCCREPRRRLGRGRNSRSLLSGCAAKIGQTRDSGVRSARCKDRTCRRETGCCKRGVSDLIRLFSSSSASASVRVTVVSMAAIWLTIRRMRGLWSVFRKYDGNPFFQIFRFADIEHGTRRIEHAVDAGQFGQRGKELPGVETHDLAILPEPCANTGKNRLETLPRQTPGTPVVAAAMVAIDQQAAIGQIMGDVVPESMIREF